MIKNNIGAYVDCLQGKANLSVLDGGGADGVIQNGTTIDRLAYNSPESAVVFVPVTATLTADKTAIVLVGIEDSPDDSTWTAYTDFTGTATITLTGGLGGTTESGVIELDLDLLAADRYFRVNTTTTLNENGGTDVALVSNCIVLGGSDTLPL